MRRTAVLLLCALALCMACAARTAAGCRSARADPARSPTSQRVDFNLSSKSSFPAPPGDIECGIVRPAKTVMRDFLVDAEALLAARLERVSLDDISRHAQPNPLHPQHGAYHYG